MDKSEDENISSSFVTDNTAAAKKKKKIREPKCKDYLNIFDTLIMRSIFIYKYEPSITSKKADFFDLFMKDAKKWQKEYVRPSMASGAG